MLDQQVDHLDAAAREPQNGQSQDRIRRERQAVRSPQAAVGC